MHAYHYLSIPPKRMLQRWRVAALMLFAMLFTTGCSSVDMKSFTDTKPAFELTEYFAGKTYAYGIFQSRGGTVERQFRVEIDGYFDGDTFVLDEDFIYDDGETDKRIWRITQTGDNTYEGRADDIVGVAEGKTVGQALSWRYVLDMPYRDGTIKLSFDDLMIRQSDNVVVNRAIVRKFGIRVGEVTLFFTKTDPDAGAAQ